MWPEVSGPGEAGEKESLWRNLIQFLGGSLKQQCPVLLLPSLHPVAVDVESARVDELPNEPIFVGDVPNTGQGEGLGHSLWEHPLKGTTAPHTVDCTLLRLYIQNDRQQTQNERQLTLWSYTYCIIYYFLWGFYYNYIEWCNSKGDGEYEVM